MVTAGGDATHPSPEKLRLRPGDSVLTLPQILGLSLFRDLTRRAEGRLRGPSGHGAMVLRHYRAGEVICREGEPGWTAFYLLKTDDLVWLRESQRAAADSSDKTLATRAPEALALSTEQQLQQAEELEKREQVDADLVSLLRASAWRPPAAELAALRAECELGATGAQLEREFEQNHPQLLALDAAAQRQHAEQIEREDAALAAHLRHLADCAELRLRAQVSLRKKRTDAAPKRPPGLLARWGARVAGFSLGRPEASTHPEPPEGLSEYEGELRLDTLFEGELFGEMSCLHRAPRSATVRAVRDCYVLEFLSIVLDLLLTAERFRADLNEVYRSRILGQHLRVIPIFASAPDDVIAQLRRRAELVTKGAGEILFEEGDPSDSLYIVRTGTVKIYSRASGRVLGYRSRGEVLGDRGMVSGQPRAASCAAYAHPLGEHYARGREVPTLNVELVRIDRTLFEEVCGRYPAFRQEVLRIAQAGTGDLAKNQAALAQNTSRFSALGLSQGRQLMLIDLERCTSCNDCVKACGDVHQDGLPRLALSGPRFGKYLVPTSCRQCSDPVCLIGCPVGAIHHGSAGQIVIEDWCIGCGLCAAQCPYDAIDLSSVGHKEALVCDQCATLPGGPQCVQVCPHDAAQRVDATAFFSRTRVT